MPSRAWPALPLPDPAPATWPALPVVSRPPQGGAAQAAPAQGDLAATSVRTHDSMTATTRLQPPDEEPRKRPRRGSEATEAVRARASALGLLGPLDDEGGSPPLGAHAGGAYAARLQQDLLAQAAEAWDTPRLATALTWTERFVEASEGRTLFLPARGPRGDAGKTWNRRTLDLLAHHICTSTPLQRTRGEHVSVDVARSYAGAIYLLRCREAGYDIAPHADSFVAPLATRTVRRSQPLAQQQRALGTALRAVHISAAATAGFVRRTRQGKERWAVLVGSHNLLLRGGEPGVSSTARAEPRRILRGRSFQWQPPSHSIRGRLWLLVWVVPIKDPTGKHTGFPCPVGRRHDGVLGSDPLCPYDALAEAWWQRMHGDVAFPVDSAGQPAVAWWTAPVDATRLALPMFLGASGRTWTTDDSRALFREVAQAAGLDPTDVHARAARIGGATDARARLGDAGRQAIQRRGRWCSEVAQIYQRELLEDQLQLSAEIGDVLADSLEELGLGWVQPACV